MQLGSTRQEESARSQLILSQRIPLEESVCLLLLQNRIIPQEESL